MKIVASIRELVGSACCVKKISKGSGKNKISISLKSEKPGYLVVDFDSPISPIPISQIRPDFLFASDTGGKTISKKKGDPRRLIPIEISTGPKTATKVRDQLQAGVNRVVSNINSELDPKLIPVYLGKMGKIERSKLRKPGWRIKFRDKYKFVEPISVGEKFPISE